MGVADEQFYEVRGEAQTDEMYYQTSSESQYVHDDNAYTETQKSSHAMDGLMADEGAVLTSQSDSRFSKQPGGPSDWKAAAKKARPMPSYQGEEKSDAGDREYDS